MEVRERTGAHASKQGGDSNQTRTQRASTRKATRLDSNLRSLYVLHSQYERILPCYHCWFNDRRKKGGHWSGWRVLGDGKAVNLAGGGGGPIHRAGACLGASESSPVRLVLRNTSREPPYRRAQSRCGRGASRTRHLTRAQEEKHTTATQAAEQPSTRARTAEKPSTQAAERPELRPQCSLAPRAAAVPEAEPPLAIQEAVRGSTAHSTQQGPPPYSRQHFSPGRPPAATGSLHSTQRTPPP